MLRKKGGTSISEQEGSPSGRPKCVSDYEESDDEIHTPTDSEDEDKSGRRMRGRGLVVNENTNFSTFQ